MKKLLICLLLISGSYAVNAAEGPNWNFIEGSYSKLDIDELSEMDPDGFGILGSFLISDDIFIFAGYTTTDDDFTMEGIKFDMEYDETLFGLGYVFYAVDTTDFYGVVSYIKPEVCAGAAGESICFDDDGYGLGIGVRSMLDDRVELSARIDHIDIDGETDTSFTLGAGYFFTKNFSVGLNYSKNDDANMYGISCRLSF